MRHTTTRIQNTGASSRVERIGVPVPANAMAAADSLSAMAGRMGKIPDVKEYYRRISEAADCLRTAGPFAALKRLYLEKNHPNQHYRDFRLAAHKILTDAFGEVGPNTFCGKRNAVVSLLGKYPYCNCLILCGNESVKLAFSEMFPSSVTVACSNESISSAYGMVIFANPGKNTQAIANRLKAEHMFALVASGTPEEKWADSFLGKKGQNGPFALIGLFGQPAQPGQAPY